MILDTVNLKRSVETYIPLASAKKMIAIKVVLKDIPKHADSVKNANFLKKAYVSLIIDMVRVIKKSLRRELKR